MTFRIVKGALAWLSGIDASAPENEPEIEPQATEIESQIRAQEWVAPEDDDA